MRNSRNWKPSQSAVLLIGILLTLVALVAHRFLPERRFALDTPCNGTTMTPSSELTIDLGAPATAPSGWALAVDAITGDVLAADMIYDTSTAAFFRNSGFGVTPRPGAVDAAILPFFRWGAPVAVETVT